MRNYGMITISRYQNIYGTKTMMMKMKNKQLTVRAATKLKGDRGNELNKLTKTRETMLITYKGMKYHLQMMKNVKCL